MLKEEDNKELKLEKVGFIELWNTVNLKIWKYPESASADAEASPTFPSNLKTINDGDYIPEQAFNWIVLQKMSNNTYINTNARQARHIIKPGSVHFANNPWPLKNKRKNCIPYFGNIQEGLDDRTSKDNISVFIERHQ